jgi:hypothetical protein
MHDLRALIAIPLAIAAAFVGYAVAQTWNATLTAFALCGFVLVLGIAAHGVGNAAGVALHDRRGGSVPLPPYQPPVGIADPLTVHRALELQSRTAARDRQATLDGWTPAAGYSVTSWDGQQEGQGWE